MEWQVILLLVVAIPIILFPVAYVWYMNVGGIYAAIQEARQKRAAARGHLGAKTGASAIIGRRVKSTVVAISRPMLVLLFVGMPVVIYGSVIWFFLAGFGWWVALALGLALPAIAVPVAFAWYLNVSGMYQVIRDARQRQRRRAEAVREAEEIVRGKVAVGALKTEQRSWLKQSALRGLLRRGARTAPPSLLDSPARSDHIMTQRTVCDGDEGARQ